MWGGLGRDRDREGSSARLLRMAGYARGNVLWLREEESECGFAFGSASERVKVLKSCLRALVIASFILSATP